MVAAQRELFAEQRGIAARTVYAGIGEGGDRTLAIDRQCEDIVFAELERLHAEGHEFRAISEERGEVAFGDSGSPGQRDRRSARRLAERAPHASLALAQHRDRLRPDDGGRRVGLRLRLRRRRGVLRRAAARGRPLDGTRAARRGPGLRPRGGRDRVGQARADRCRCSRRSTARPTGSAPIGSIAISPLLRRRRPVRRHADRPCLPLRRRGRRPADRPRGGRRGRLRRRGPGREPGPRRPLPRRSGPRPRASGDRARGPGARRAAGATA